jgi:hypothetical protein
MASASGDKNKDVLLVSQGCELTRRYAKSLVVERPRRVWSEYLMTFSSRYSVTTVEVKWVGCDSCASE